MKQPCMDGRSKKRILILFSLLDTYNSRNTLKHQFPFYCIASLCQYRCVFHPHFIVFLLYMLSVWLYALPIHAFAPLPFRVSSSRLRPALLPAAHLFDNLPCFTRMHKAHHYTLLLHESLGEGSSFFGLTQSCTTPTSSRVPWLLPSFWFVWHSPTHCTRRIRSHSP